MRENYQCNILNTTVDRLGTVEFIEQALRDLLASNKVPEMKPENYSWYLSVLLQELEGINILVVTDTANPRKYSASAFTSGNVDHHVLGYGMTLQCTFSTCSVCTKILMHELRALAKSLTMDWLMIQHRVLVHTYRSKIYEVR